jgi:hypothetical protein
VKKKIEWKKPDAHSLPFGGPTNWCVPQQMLATAGEAVLILVALQTVAQVSVPSMEAAWLPGGCTEFQ